MRMCMPFSCPSRKKLVAGVQGIPDSGYGKRRPFRVNGLRSARTIEQVAVESFWAPIPSEGAPLNVRDRNAACVAAPH